MRNTVCILSDTVQTCDTLILAEIRMKQLSLLGLEDEAPQVLVNQPLAEQQDAEKLMPELQRRFW